MKLFIDSYENVKVVYLKLNYRSCFEIVDAAERIISNNKVRLERPRQNTLKNRKKGQVVVCNFENIEEESSYVIAEIKKLKDNESLNDIAIIYRSEHCANYVEEILRLEGIKYIRNCKTVDFYELEVIKVLMSYFRIIADSASLYDYLAILNHPNRDISREALACLKGLNSINICEFTKSIENYYKVPGLNIVDDRILNIKKLENQLKQLNNMPIRAALIFLLKGVGLYNDLMNNYKMNMAYPVSFDELIDEFKERIGKYESIEGFLKEVESRNIDNEKKRINGELSGDRITFITAHASKGLEYKIVFIIGLQEGLFPHRKNLEGDRLEEERRLFYVAMTRAKEKLYIIGRGSLHGKRTSRFIGELSDNQSFIASNSSLSRNSSNASATASYSSSSSIYESSGSTLGSDSSSQ